MSAINIGKLPQFDVSGNPMSNNVQAEYNVVPVISVGDPPTGVIWNMVTTNEYPYLLSGD